MSQIRRWPAKLALLVRIQAKRAFTEAKAKEKKKKREGPPSGLNEVNDDG